jgi:hypothetical protein
MALGFIAFFWYFEMDGEKTHFGSNVSTEQRCAERRPVTKQNKTKETQKPSTLHLIPEKGKWECSLSV